MDTGKKKCFDDTEECLDLFGVAENIKTLLINNMEKWRVMFCAGDSELGELDVKGGIFREILYLL